MMTLMLDGKPLPGKPHRQSCSATMAHPLEQRNDFQNFNSETPDVSLRKRY